MGRGEEYNQSPEKDLQLMVNSIFIVRVLEQFPFPFRHVLDVCLPFSCAKVRTPRNIRKAVSLSLVGGWRSILATTATHPAAGDCAARWQG